MCSGEKRTTEQPNKEAIAQGRGTPMRRTAKISPAGSRRCFSPNTAFPSFPLISSRSRASDCQPPPPPNDYVDTIIPIRFTGTYGGTKRSSKARKEKKCIIASFHRILNSTSQWRNQVSKLIGLTIIKSSDLYINISAN